MSEVIMRSVRDADVAGKRVLLRAGLNVPLDLTGSVSPQDFRLHRACNTIEYLAARGAKIIVLAHLGRKGESLRPVAEALEVFLPDIKIRFSDAPFDVVREETLELLSGECLILENVRRNPGEERNDETFAQELASLADVFVNDAFADSHRAHASIVGVAKFLPSYAGLLMEEEAEHLSEALVPPEHALAIVGGAKFETKEPLISKLITLYEKVCVGGALANDFLKARGVNIGASIISDTAVQETLANDSHIMVPTDYVMHEDRIVDAGKETAKEWSDLIRRSPFVLWNGPLGVFEQGYTEGSDALAKAIANSGVRAIVGGGDTLASLEKCTFDETKVFRSTGGGAMLQFLVDGTLPGIEALKE